MVLSNINELRETEVSLKILIFRINLCGNPLQSTHQGVTAPKQDSESKERVENDSENDSRRKRRERLCARKARKLTQ